MRPITMTYAPTALDRDGIALAQTTAGAADLVINGALASGGVVQLADQQAITLFSAGNLAAITFTAYGTDRDGNALSTSRAGPGAGLTVAFPENLYTVTRIATSALVGTNVEAGVDGTGASRPIPLDLHIVPFAVSFRSRIASGTATYKLQYTYDDVFTSTWADGTQTWQDSPTMTGQTGTSDAAINDPIIAARLAITTAGGSVEMRVVQAGN